jgi:NTE family protein
MAADERTIAALGRVAILAHLPHDRLADLAAAVDEQRLATGEWLFHQGDEPDALYVVASGRLAVVDEAADPPEVLREAERGDAVGELGVVDGAPRAAGVRAVRDSVVSRVPGEAFRELLAEPDAQRALLASLTELVRGARRSTADRRPRVIAVLGEATASVANRVADALAADLATHGSVAVLRPDGHTPDTPDHRRRLAAEWGEHLDRAEREQRWVLLVAGRDAGPGWRRFATAQADRLVVLAGRGDPPAWAADLPADRARDLVVLDPGASSRWWEVVDPRSHHHTGAHPDRGSLAALCRRLDGRALGLVLAGGGARGLAHFGVYDALVSAGVVIDRFGGTSAGALAGGIFAMGLPPDEALEAARRHVVAARPLSDYTLPAVSLVRGGRLERTGRRFFADRRIEDLPKGFFSVSADLITGDQIVHTRGSLWQAVRASISIPGLMPPVEAGDRLLVDGGLLNNLPADVMTADPDGSAICVDLRRRYQPGGGFGLLPVQPPALVRRLITGSDASLPTMQDTLMRTVDLAASGGSFTGLPRVVAVIRPDVSDVGLLSWNQIDVAVDAGRDAARDALEAHPELADRGS